MPSDVAHVPEGGPDHILVTIILIILRSATKGNVREYRAIKYVWRIMQCNYEKTCYKSFEAVRSRLRSRKIDLKNLKAMVAMSNIKVTKKNRPYLLASSYRL
jgi:hypothetical protein